MTVDAFMTNVLAELVEIKGLLAGGPTIEKAPGKTAAKKTAKKSSKKAAAKSNGETTGPTKDDAQRALKEFATKHGIEDAEKLVANFNGAEKISDIPEEMWPDFIAACATEPEAPVVEKGLFG